MKKLLKQLLSRRVIDRFQQLNTGIDLAVIKIVRRSRLLTALYYAFFSSEFHREMLSVVNGRYRYYQSQVETKPSSVMLRRNIHRLEKGLCMRPRRDIFAESYIAETVTIFSACVVADVLTDQEYRWAHDVLAEYFSLVGFSSAIEQAKDSFEHTLTIPTCAEVDCTNKPFSHGSVSKSDINLADFKALCDNRSSVRWFNSKPVPKDILDEAITIASTAPSACNRQPFEFFVFDDPKEAQKIGSIAMGTAGFSQNFQCIIVVVGDLSAYPFEKDRHIIYIDTALASMQLLLALETCGLSSCIINWPDVDRHERQMAAELGLESYQRPTMLISVGYADDAGMIPFSAKKIASDLVRRVQ
jgi:nitroreductase